MSIGSVDSFSSASADHDGSSLIQTQLRKFTEYLESNTLNVSPQLGRKIHNLVKPVSLSSKNDLLDLVQRVDSLFKRLLIEVVQAHYSTKQREQDFFKLIRSKKFPLEPQLTDLIINLLMKLYQSSSQYSDNSYERKVLIKYLLKELSDVGQTPLKFSENVVVRVVQKLYATNCFRSLRQDNKSSRLELREDLTTSNDIRQQHDIGLIKLAQQYNIRLAPESWAHLLYVHPSHETISYVQSLLDRHQDPIAIEELISTINSNDKYSIAHLSNHFQQVNDLIHRILGNPATVKSENVSDLLEELIHLKELFDIRQRRKKPIKLVDG